MAEARVQRRLAAILAADVVGYSRLVGADEEGTLARLRTLRDDLISPTVSTYQGRTIKTAGDGILLEFASVVDAVRAALDVQRAMAAQNAETPADKRIEFRIGINLGDVVVEADGDLVGDGVNVAARLEAIAEPGGICLSRSAYDQVNGKVDAEFVDIGDQTLKNIAQPIRSYRVGSGRTVGAAPELPALSLPDKPSIAVLPFQNMSGDPGQDYFADGIVEEIITGLSRLRWLFVIARNSSFTYKGRAVDVKQVGRELGVHYVLEGSVRRSGTRVRITGQLIDTATGIHLWADRFDGGMEDIFDLQDQMTQSVIGAIAPKLEQAEIDRSRRKPTERLDAYDHYLRGLAGVHRWNREGTEEAYMYFHRAIQLDPDFAAAYGMAAGCFISRKAGGWMLDRAQESADAERLARRAIELGKDDPIALCWSGITLAYVACEVEEGVAFIDRARSLDPNYAPAWGFSGWARIFLGQMDLAIQHLAHAVRLSPLDPLIYNVFSATALAHFLSGRHDEACVWAERAMRGAPTRVTAVRTFAASCAMAGRMEEAHKAIERLRQMHPKSGVADAQHHWPFRRPQDLERYIEGLRRAGLPE
jgi:TolB-like protein/class 3 adenylate cyclase/Flp pilus assembly protein TadD